MNKKKKELKPDYEADKKLLQELRKKKREKPIKKRTREETMSLIYKKIAEVRGITVEQLEKEREERKKRFEKEAEEFKKQMEEEFQAAKRIGFRGSFWYWSKIYGTERLEMMLKRLKSKYEIRKRVHEEGIEKHIKKVKNRLLKDKDKLE